MSAGGGGSTALDVFKQTIVADMQSKFAAAQEAHPSAAAWREGLSVQVLDAAILKMWGEANAATKSFFRHAAEKKREWEGERTASSGEDEQVAAPGGGEDESASDMEIDHDDDDDDDGGGSSKDTGHAGPVTIEAGGDDTCREDIAEKGDTGRGNHGGGGRARTNGNSDDPSEIPHTNNNRDDDAMSEDRDDSDTEAIRLPNVMVTRSRASDEAQAKDAARPVEKQRARKSTPSDEVAFDAGKNSAGKMPPAAVLVTGSRVSDEAQAKSTGRSREKQKARKSALGKAEVRRRGDGNNNNNSNNGTVNGTVNNNRRLGGRSPVPAMPRKSFSEPATPRAETKETKPEANVPALDAIGRVASAKESETPARKGGGARELAPAAKEVVAGNTSQSSTGKPAAASARGKDKQQGGRNGVGPDPKQTRGHLSVTGVNQTAIPKREKDRKQQPSAPRNPPVLDGPKSAPGSRDVSAVVPDDAMKPAAALPSACLPYRPKDNDGEAGGAPPKRGRGRPRKVARLAPDPTAQVSATPPAPVPIACDSNAKERDEPTKAGRGRPPKVAPPGQTSVVRRAEGEARLSEDEGATHTKPRYYGGDDGDDNLHTTIAPSGREAKAPERDSRSESPEDGKGPAGEVPKPSRPRGRPRKTTEPPTGAMVPVTVAAAALHALRGDTKADNGSRRRTQAEQEDESAAFYKKASAGGSNNNSRGHVTRGEATPRPISSTTKKRPGGGSDIPKSAGGGDGGGGGKRGQGGDGVEVTGAEDPDGGGVTGSTVFGVLRRKAAVIEVRWEVDVQTLGRNTEKKWQWFTASVDLTQPHGIDDEKHMQWKTEYARVGGLPRNKSKIVFLSKNTLRDALQGYMEKPLQWREKGTGSDL